MIITCYHCNTELLTQIEIDNHRCDLSEELKRLKAELEALKCCGNCAGWDNEKLIDGCDQLVRWKQSWDRCDRWEKRK